MGSGSEALRWKNGFRAFHRAKTSSQDTQVNTVGCVFLPKKQIKFLKTLSARRVARTYILAIQVGAHTKSTPKNTCYCYLVFISGDLSIKHNINLVSTSYGTILFVSDTFEGSISDKEIVRLFVFLDFLNPGDVNIADQGFLLK